MRKLSISFLLSLLLVLAQQGAVFHELGHIVQASNSHVRVHADTAADKTCQLCLAYSQLASPASHTVNLPYFEPAICVADCNPSLAAPPAEVLAPRSRGPPAATLKS
jgi:hypothetical protein